MVDADASELRVQVDNFGQQLEVTLESILFVKTEAGTVGEGIGGLEKGSDACQTSCHDICVHEGVDEGEDLIIDILVDVVGDLPHHRHKVVHMGVQSASLPSC